MHFIEFIIYHSLASMLVLFIAIALKMTLANLLLAYIVIFTIGIVFILIIIDLEKRS